jgi:hypothetical protein
MAAMVDSAFLMISDAKKNTLVLCDNYGQAGAVNFYSKIPNMNAVSFNADYINWFPKFRYQNVIVVKEAKNSADRSEELHLFKSIRKIGSVNNPLAREFGTTVFLYEHALADINARVDLERREKQ